jgi:MFS family permease
MILPYDPNWYKENPMAAAPSNKFRQIFQRRAFRAFWLSFTFSALGDVLSRVALTWYVYDLTHSPTALGLLAFTYTGPVIIGGLIAGPLLDRFDRRKVMIADNLIRGAAVLLIPLLHALGTLALWHVYAVSIVYGGLMMISLAGSPSLVPDLVEESQLDTANALETLSYTLSGVIGPPLAGLLIPLISSPNVVIFDGLSYFMFAFALLGIRLPPVESEPQTQPDSYSLRDAVHLLIGNRVLLSTTAMFMLFNLGLGVLYVWLPIVSDQALRGGSELYGALLGAMAVGEVISSLLAGTWKLPVTLGIAICLAQALSGMVIVLMALKLSTPLVAVSLGLLGFFSAPLTIWAQTLRMKVIPNPLRGRTFALLRTLMQSTSPIGGAIAGVILPLLTMPVMIAVSAALIGLPGLIGYRVKALRSAD